MKIALAISMILIGLTACKFTYAPSTSEGWGGNIEGWEGHIFPDGGTFF